MPATKPTVYLETHSQDPAYNLAFEETVLKVRKDHCSRPKSEHRRRN